MFETASTKRPTTESMLLFNPGVPCARWKSLRLPMNMAWHGLQRNDISNISWASGCARAESGENTVPDKAYFCDYWRINGRYRLATVKLLNGKRNGHAKKHIPNHFWSCKQAIDRMGNAAGVTRSGRASGFHLSDFPRAAVQYEYLV